MRMYQCMNCGFCIDENKVKEVFEVVGKGIPEDLQCNICGEIMELSDGDEND